MCEQAAAVIHNAIVFEQTQEDSLTDPLTGLPNTRWLFQQLTRELARAERLATSVALVLMDLNGFKHINDTYGHHGRLGAAEAARVLRETIRTTTRAFGTVATSSSLCCRAAAATRPKTSARSCRTQCAVSRSRLSPVVTCRCRSAPGWPCIPQDGDGYEALLASADRRMYADKSAARTAASAKSNPMPALSDSTSD